MATVEGLFASFGKGKDLDSRTFVKICKDTKLLGGGLTQTDCDLIFTKCKTKSIEARERVLFAYARVLAFVQGSVRLTFSEFEEAMDLVAKKKNQTLEELLAGMGGVKGPEFKGTPMDAVRFYDDKSTFTGVHAHGGPSTCDRKGRGTFSDPAPNQPTGTTKITLADMCDRSTPDVRGVNKNFRLARGNLVMSSENTLGYGIREGF
ncbi:p25-alpha family protein [Cyclospora cayetanensis]|uniref:P25-alpha family protein n=1 Tax=Cyclospora cayetanensis TaxID=88456 RepID=A0A1D3CZN9_9EIME|nr:p25-alpha family protein [Cyclospora cayetanensis]